jgi:ATP/maltotriose-dependent transcriptional regulator MalT
VLSQAARFQALAGEDVETDVREALALAEELGLDEIRAHLLVTMGQVRENLGDPAARADIEEALRIAPAGAFPVRIRAYSSLASIADWDGDLREANRFAETADELARRFAGTASARWTRGNVITICFDIGEWDRLARESDDFLAQSAAIGPHYHDAHIRLLRALLRCARGDDADALADVTAGLERAREVKDPQQLNPAIGVAVYVFAELGRLDEASELLDEAMSWETLLYPVEQLEWAADLLGRSSELAGLLPSSDRPRIRALRAAIEGRFADAAEEYEAMGAVTSAAYGRLRAGDEHLRPALEFFRSVGAKRYVERGEALLARSA